MNRFWTWISAALMVAFLSVGNFDFAYAEEQNTAAVLNNLVDKVSGGLEQVSHMISAAAPKAWSLIVQGSFAEALVGVIFSVILFVLSIILFAVTVVFRHTIDDHPGTVFSGIGSVVCFVFSLVILGTNLAMVISPEAITARDLLFHAIR